MVDSNTIKALNEICKDIDKTVIEYESKLLKTLVNDIVYRVTKYINECNVTENTADKICNNEESED